MNEMVQNCVEPEVLGASKAQSVSSPYPRIVRRTEQLLGETWTLHFSEDLQPLFEVQTTLTDALEALLMVETDGAYHQRIDVGSILCSVLVRSSVRELRLASPQFWTERFLLYALHQNAAPQSHDYEALKLHVQFFEEISPLLGPSEIEQVTAVEGLTKLHIPLRDVHDPPLLNSLSDLEERTAHYGQQILSRQNRYRSGFMERITQVGFDLAADYPIFRVYMLRFVAMLPFLDFDEDGTEVKRLLSETLRRACTASRHARRQNEDDRTLRPLPLALEWAFYCARFGARILPASWVAGATRSLVKRFARMLIAGQNIAEAEQTLDHLSESGRDATLDQLGELVVSEAEADTYLERVLILIRGFADTSQYGSYNKAGIPRPNVSVKMSALCAHFNPDDPEGTYTHVAPRVIQILRAAKEHQVFINMDAEHYLYRDLNFVVLKRILLDTEDLRDFPWVGLAVQSYLRDASKHVDDIIELGRLRGTVMPLRLVKGAYWDQETIEAEAHGFDAPQFLNKCETDIHFQQMCLKILEHADAVQLCVGSHNLRDHAFAHAAREILFPQAPLVEHQVLHMTSEPLAVAMAEMGWPVRNYIPVGSLLVGMGYLVRRIMENSSQVGVLTQARRGLEPGQALKRPSESYTEKRSAKTWVSHVDMHAQPGALPDFANVAPARLYRPEHRDSLQRAIDANSALSRIRVLDDPQRSGDTAPCFSPSEPEEVVGHIQNVSPEDVSGFVDRAWHAHAQWSELPSSGRSACLVRAAEILRMRRMEAAVLVAHEGGKARNEALADVDEAIDFLRFYAREAVRLCEDPETGDKRQSRGVVAVIAPWNFPLAIACGMTSASLVTGNCVLLKPARQTALVGEYLVRLLHEAGVPRDVLCALPGSGRTVGAALVHHEKVAGCVFTGSRAVGSWIFESMAHRIAPAIHPDKPRLPAKVIAEMGGKNAIIVTANADLDEAVSGALYSSFAHSGQKCSAASRIFVDERILELFRRRFTRAANDLKMGPALSPGVDVNPVIAKHEAERLMEAVVEGRAECEQVGGSVLVDRSQEWLERTGHLVGPTILEIPAEAYLDLGSIARRELFGPIVHLIPFKSLDQAIELLNDCEYALTGGVFSQSDDEIDLVLEKLECGNIYVNRPITGARVAIEPFGGFLHSGTGPKAGGTAYLEALCPIVATENPRNEALDLGLSEPPPISFNECLAFNLKRPAPAAVKLNESHGRIQRLRTALRSLPSDSMESQTKDHASELLDWMEHSLETLILHKDLNRTVPGQESYNRLNQRRGDLLLISAEGRISSHGLLHVIASLTLQNSVHITALDEETAQVWQLLAHRSDLSDLTVDEGPLLAACRDPRFATVVYDGFADELTTDLSALLQFPQTAGELRRFYSLSEGPFPPDWRDLCLSHLRTRAFAINTLRHGAPLNIDLGPLKQR
jgi:RHH-type proline utilization regulon transcriptional repressor/proline dehydrogenase/delta 1-pyrroline-5-carboxylate dehydrogenase